MSAIDDLPPLREVVSRHGLLARRSLGQNFLFDLNLTSRIARSAGSLAGVTVVEVGPGPGGLTRAILAAGAARVIAVERDPRCLPALAEIAAHYPGRLEVVEADALTFDPRPLVGPGPAKVIANLPYNIGTPLLAGWLDRRGVAALVAIAHADVSARGGRAHRRRRPSDPKDYGRLGVLCGWRTQAAMLFDVPPSAFVPPPKITSSVVHLAPRPDPAPCRVGALEAVTRAAFGQRRKMLRQSLKALVPQPGALIAAAGLSETARAESVPVAGFVALAKAFDEGIGRTR